MERALEIRGQQRGADVGAAGVVGDEDGRREGTVDEAVLVRGQGGTGRVDLAEGREVEFAARITPGGFEFEEIPR